MNNMGYNSMTMPQVEEEQRSFVTQVYMWMFLALCVTGFVALQVATSVELLQLIVSTPLFYVLIIGELILVAVLSGLVNKLSPAFAMVMFFAYSILNGATLSVIFLAYTSASIANTFFITAGMFGIISFYGYVTKTDLTKWGSILFMALIGMILASVVNWFLHSSALYWVVTYVGIIIFTGLTAYDMQKIKNMAIAVEEGSEEAKKAAVIGALALYLDFINLFLLLLRIFGGRRK